MVYQEMLSFPNLTVTGNIFAGREITRGGRLLNGEMRERTRAALLADLHLAVSPDAEAESLSAAHRQLVQVARALAFDCRILVLDEPTTSLTDAEADHLLLPFSNGWKARAASRCSTSRIASQRCFVSATASPCCATALTSTHSIGARSRPDTIVRAMVGRDLPPRATDHGSRTTDRTDRVPLLSVDGLGRRPSFRNISLGVSAGEIVGLFGLVGSGRSELLETIFGVYRAEAGRVRVAGDTIDLTSPAAAARGWNRARSRGTVQRQGLFFNLAIRDNLVIPGRVVRRDVLVHAARERREAQALVDTWRIKARDVDVAPDALSGGNQQKIVVAKWLATQPKVILLDEPTKGVDVGAKFEIHEIVQPGGRCSGAACLVASSDLPGGARPVRPPRHHARRPDPGTADRRRSD